MKRILYLIFGFVVTFASSTFIKAAEFPRESVLAPEYEPTFDDWVDAPTGDTLCKGYYQETPPPPCNFAPGETPPITITSKRGEFQEGGESTLEGQVHLIQGTQQVFADQTFIRRNANTGKIETITALGHVKLLEPGLRLQGTRADVGIPGDTKYIENVHFRLYERHARGTAQSICAFGKNRMDLKEVSYTTCAPRQNTWHLKASNITLNKLSGRGRARHAKMYMKDIPIFYFPYVDFPIDNRRQTGFLFPIFGSTNNSGFELATPFYWNIAPNYDAVLTPRLYTRRGLNLEGGFRYLLPKSRGEIQTAIMPYDSLYRRFKAQNLANHPQYRNNDPRVLALRKGGDARTAFSAKHSTQFNPNWFANVNYNVVGDDNYFMDFSNSLNAANTTQLLQQGDINYQDRHWNSLLRVQKYQTLHPFNGPITTNPYERLPQLAFSNTYPDLAGGFAFASNGEFAHFSHPLAPFTGDTVTTGQRYHYRPGVSLPMTTPGWFFKPRLQCDFLSYSLRLGRNDAYNGYPANPGRAIPMFDLDSGLIFERPFCLFNNSFIQTLEPRAYYLYVPYRNQNSLPIFDASQTGFDYNLLFRDNRFNGIDRLGDANQLTFAISSRFLDSYNGKERLSLTLGEIFYFRPRLVTVLNSQLFPNARAQELPDYNKGRSPLVGVARYRLQSDITLNGLVEWDTYQNHTNKRALWLQYQPSELNVFNIGYQYLKRNPVQLDLLNIPLLNLTQPQTINQTDISAAWEITRQWRLLGRWHYDFTNNRSTDLLAGIEQQGCCTAVRLSFIRYLQPNAGQKQYVNGVFFQFVFKGFAGVGHNRLAGTLSKSIPGYKWRGTDF